MYVRAAHGSRKAGPKLGALSSLPADRVGELRPSIILSRWFFQQVRNGMKAFRLSPKNCRACREE